jgi:photosystem II stability/assembly factor-like uncharacterized protein
MKIIINKASKRFNRLSFSIFWLVLSVGMTNNLAFAQEVLMQNKAVGLYQDQLDLPVLTMASAQQSLLLDTAFAGERIVVVGERGHILYSDDHGENWQQAQVDSRAQLNAVFFIDDNTGWAVGEDALIVQTTDGGVSWHKQFDDRDAEVRGPLLDIYFKNAEQGFAIGVFNKLYFTDNGGENWQNWQQHADNLDEWHFFAMAVTTGHNAENSSGNSSIYLTSEAGLLFRSIDGGESFSPLKTDHDGSFHGVLVKRDSSGKIILLAFGVGGKLFSSTDSGNSWLEISTGIESGLAGGSWLSDGSALIVGADGVMLKVSSDLKRVAKYQRDNGLPLNNVMQSGPDSLVLVGLGGIQKVLLTELVAPAIKRVSSSTEVQHD